MAQQHAVIGDVQGDLQHPLSAGLGRFGPGGQHEERTAIGHPSESRRAKELRCGDGFREGEVAQHIRRIQGGSEEVSAFVQQAHVVGQKTVRDALGMDFLLRIGVPRQRQFLSRSDSDNECKNDNKQEARGAERGHSRAQPNG